MPPDYLLPHLLPTSLQMLPQQILLASSLPTALRPRTGPRELAEKAKARTAKEKARTARERERTRRTMARVRAREKIMTITTITPAMYRSYSRKLKQHFKPADRNSRVVQVVSMTLSTVCLAAAVLVMPKGKLETLVVLTRTPAWE
jgi:hypothetical protein